MSRSHPCSRRRRRCPGAPRGPMVLADDLHAVGRPGGGLLDCQHGIGASTTICNLLHELPTPPPRRQLTTLNELNQTLKGQLHNVTSGLETIIHSARAHQAPNGAAAQQAPNGAHHTNGNGARPPAGAGGVLLQPPPQQQQQQPAAGGGAPSGGSDDGDSVLHTSTLSCVVQHPGALCCTKTTASSSPATMTCTVSLETTARWVWSVVCHMGAAGRQRVWGQWAWVWVYQHAWGARKG